MRQDEAVRRYYKMAEIAGSDTALLRMAVWYGQIIAGLPAHHPHIRAMLEYCNAHDRCSDDAANALSPDAGMSTAATAAAPHDVAMLN